MRTYTTLSVLFLASASPWPSAADTVRSYTSTFPTCRCAVNKPVQFVQYMSDSAIRARLNRWDPRVQDVTLSKWNSYSKSQNVTTPPDPDRVLCTSEFGFNRNVAYKLPVIPPTFLKPFVGVMQAQQRDPS